MVSKKDRIKREWEALQSDQKTGFFNSYGKERDALQNLLGDDEPLEAWLPGKRTADPGEGESEDRDGVVVATDRRILFVKEEVWGRPVNSIVMAYHAIEGVNQTTKTSAWSQKTVLSVTGSGNMSMNIEISGSEKAMQVFMDVVNRHIYEPSGTGQVVQQTSAMEELQRAAQLHASGDLTDAEFQAIKANLLSKI